MFAMENTLIITFVFKRAKKKDVNYMKVIHLLLQLLWLEVALFELCCRGVNWIIFEREVLFQSLG